MNEQRFFRVYFYDQYAGWADCEVPPTMIAPTVTTLPVAKALAEKHVRATGSEWRSEWYRGYKNGENYWTRGFDTGNELAVMVIAPGRAKP